ncbi:MAG TPA: hypothetical protein VGR28_11975 [Candidatus Thermoplasmatota archaeon]|jgi:hypothetical protein|nr:hypothetical protein [Candidatus Thermoplasmatota archaeon]
MRAWRVGAAVALAAAFLVVQVPAHEYGHCLAYWARGGAVCYVRFAPPGDALPSADDGAAAGAIGQAFVGPTPWWEHAVMYGAHFAATVAVGLWLGRWAARDAGRAEDPAEGRPRARRVAGFARQPFGRPRA